MSPTNIVMLEEAYRKCYIHVLITKLSYFWNRINVLCERFFFVDFQSPNDSLDKPKYTYHGSYCFKQNGYNKVNIQQGYRNTLVIDTKQIK